MNEGLVLAEHIGKPFALDGAFRVNMNIGVVSSERPERFDKCLKLADHRGMLARLKLDYPGGRRLTFWGELPVVDRGDVMRRVVLGWVYVVK